MSKKENETLGRAKSKRSKAYIKILFVLMCILFIVCLFVFSVFFFIAILD